MSKTKEWVVNIEVKVKGNIHRRSARVEIRTDRKMPKLLRDYAIAEVGKCIEKDDKEQQP